MLSSAFKRDEVTPLKRNNETKKCTIEIQFAQNEIVNWVDDGNGEGMDCLS